MKSHMQNREFSDAFDIGCGSIGIYRGYIVTPETIANIVKADSYGPFEGTGYGLIFQLNPDFIERISKGEEEARHMQVFRSSNNQLMLLIRLQVGSSMTALVMNIAEREFVRMLKACLRQESIPLVGYCSKTGRLVKMSVVFGDENMRRMLRDAESAPVQSRETQVSELAKSAAWILELECMSLIPSRTVEEVTVSAVLPSYPHLDESGAVH
ncbi:MAG: hypothetical protein FHP94_03155 [Denitromonas halophila]|nr:MAG: hypothetical protein FHP94_03155 [Denitromonas halophila]TVT72854.1 MAG: hypothetical protein FHP93_07655 [Denitromonas halophila]